jgi:hypothetical protein
MILFAVIFGLLCTGAILVIIGTVTKNRWGINLDTCRSNDMFCDAGQGG